MARKRISVKNETNYTMEERFNDYIAEKRGLNLSPKTITCYIESFNRFSEIIDPSINIRELTRSDVYSFSAPYTNMLLLLAINLPSSLANCSVSLE